MNWNQISKTTLTVGGGIPVWAKLPERKIAGGIVANTLVVGEKVSAGTPIAFDHVAKSVSFLKCWEVVSVTGTTNITITLKKTFLTPVLYATDVIMLMPTTMTGTGKALFAGTVTETATTYAITLLAANFDSPVAGNHLVQSSSTTEGASKSIYCQPTNLSIEDTIGGDQNLLGIPSGNKYVFENCIPSIPVVVKANITNVEWETFNEKI